MSTRRVGVLGGTFDPIHLGHLAAARAARHAIGLDEVLFVPSSDPPHRPDKPRASGYHRLQMTALAVAGEPGCSVSEIELQRPGASYTFDTLTALKEADHGRSQFFFIVGADAFADIATWSRYPAVIDLAAFAVIARPGTSLESLQRQRPDLAARMRVVPTGSTLAGFSGSASIATSSIALIPAETPQVSSTEIRRRAAAGESLNRLVPDEVEQYIIAHRLYRPQSQEPRSQSLEPKA